MKKLIFLITLFVFLITNTKAQDSNFKAQGYYYKAKSQYEAGLYSRAINYARKSISALGGTNEELQYLITMTYVKQKEWIKAEKELAKYSLVEQRSSSIKIKDFDESVDRLTNDEKRDLAMKMVDIEESAEAQRSKVQTEKDYYKTPAYTRDTLVVAITRMVDELIDFDTYFYNPILTNTIKKIGILKYALKVKGKSNHAEDTPGNYYYSATIKLTEIRTIRLKKKEFAEGDLYHYDYQDHIFFLSKNKYHLYLDYIDYSKYEPGRSFKIKQVKYSKNDKHTWNGEGHLINLPIKDNVSNITVKANKLRSYIITLNKILKENNLNLE